MPSAIYRDDLAFVHHRGFAGVSQRAAPELLRELRRAGIRSGVVVDLGCGDGTWLRAVTAAGFDGFGIERSAAFVALARRVAPRAIVRTGSLYTARIPSCVAVTALGEVLNYRAGRSAVWPALRGVFRRTFRALAPGGLFIFDMIATGRPMSYDAWRTAPTWTVMSRVAEDRRSAALTREIVTFRKRGDGFRRTAEVHVLDVVRPARVLAELRRAGFRARTRRSYGRVALLPRRVAFVARKPGARAAARRGKKSR